MILGYFTEIISLAPRIGAENIDCPDKDAINKARESMQSEIARFISDLSQKQTQFITPITEEVTGDLLLHYYLVRKKVNPLSRNDEWRVVLNLFYETIVLVKNVVKKMGILYSENFVNEWINRVDYFPFDLPKQIRIKENIEYKGIANNLSKYITDATDEVIASIIQNKKIPDGCKKPTWVKQRGSMAEAYRFSIWINGTESTMKQCFHGLDDLKRGHGTGVKIEFARSIWEVLEEYPRPPKK